jgi:hypothetical protein
LDLSFIFGTAISFNGQKKLSEFIVAGVIVAALWVLLVPSDTEANAAFYQGLARLPLWAMVSWGIFRLLGACPNIGRTCFS